MLALLELYGHTFYFRAPNVSHHRLPHLISHQSLLAVRSNIFRFRRVHTSPTSFSEVSKWFPFVFWVTNQIILNANTQFCLSRLNFLRAQLSAGSSVLIYLSFASAFVRSGGLLLVFGTRGLLRRFLQINRVTFSYGVQLQFYQTSPYD